MKPVAKTWKSRVNAAIRHVHLYLSHSCLTAPPALVIDQGIWLLEVVSPPGR
jgi:hypothetical protein